MQIGIIGMPSTGKSTVLELMAGGRSTAGGRGKAAIAMAQVPDRRIEYLSGLFKPKKTSYAQLEAIEVPGLTPGGGKGANVFLDTARKADALLHVVRVYEGEQGLYPFEEVDPLKEINDIRYEILMADLELVDKRIERINSGKKKPPQAVEEALLERLRIALEEETNLSTLNLSDEESVLLSGYQFLTVKPMLICLNLSEERLKNKQYPKQAEIEALAADKHMPLVTISASIEKDILELEEEDRELFMAELGQEETGLVRIIRGLYSMLGLISFFTVGEDEVKAWTIRAGTDARTGAGKIHSDIERGFIRAEVVAYNDFVSCGGMHGAKEKGLFRLEGKTYVIKDGDIVHYRFNV